MPARDRAVNAQTLEVKGKTGQSPAKVNSAEMTANIGASNGVLYGINQVLWPKKLRLSPERAAC
jgi:uncharacterized surface protein with fasciclin (FAS1) repeats